MENEIKDSRGDAERQRAQSETLVDIVAEMRSIAKPGETFEHTYELLCGFADRIEAAHKREVEKLNSVIQATVSHSDAEIDRLRREVAELRKQIGNAAKLREALVKLVDFCSRLWKREKLTPLLEKARAALAEPPRQCDMGTAYEQAQRFGQFCHKNRKMEKCCGDCPAFGMADCQFIWGQMPYNESEVSE